MPPKTTTTKKPDTTRSIVVVPTKANDNAEEYEGAEETEISAQVTVPEEGGWGWVVVAASFMCIFILDGVFFTFGSIFHDITDDLQIEEYLVQFMNSIAVALYFIGGPLVSALINRFGFRACTMSGAIICAIALLNSYFALNIATLMVFYGVVGGLGACLVTMSSGLVVGFYFERLRSLAMAISSVGASVGVMIMYNVNTHMIRLGGWRVTMLFHSGLVAITYFLGMTYRPLLSLAVTTTTAEDPTRTVTYLPSLAAIKASPSRTRARKEGMMPTAAERLFSAVSNAHFPTAAAVVDEGSVPTPNQPGPSTAAVSRLTLTPQGGISRRQLKQVQSIISRSSEYEKQKTELTVIMEAAKKRKWWQRLCHWEEHVPQSRPMYRDDAFYEGRLDKLPAYQKSMMDTPEEARTGLEYQMAVSRAVTAEDLKEKRGVFTTAVRRILATMMDPKLLKRCSFMMLCSSGFFTYLGYLVPYVFLPDRNKGEGIDVDHCNLFVSVMGFANTIGRIVIGILACKFSPIKLYRIACIVSGLSIYAFNMSFNLYYQYFVCVVFGFFIASLSSMRAMVIVDLYGLENLTNATGMILLFQGIASLICTPLSSVIKSIFGYAVSFYVAGTFVVIAGIVLVPINQMNAKENRKAEDANKAKESGQKTDTTDPRNPRDPRQTKEPKYDETPKRSVLQQKETKIKNNGNQ